MGGPEPDIVVTAYSKRFDAAFARLIRVEGGYVNDLADPGGATKYGISLRFLVGEGLKDLDLDGHGDFDLDMDGDIDVADIKSLSLVDAKMLYHRCFWKRLGCESIPAPLGEAMFDQGVNGGLAAARKLLQQAINRIIGKIPLRSIRLLVDGEIGGTTIRYLDSLIARNDVGVTGLVEEYRDAAADRYLALVKRNPRLGKFLTGWLRRAKELGTS